MSTNIKYSILSIFLIFTLSSCITEDDYNNDPMGNFNELWRIIDEKYCFLDYKGIDWNAIGDKYRPYINNSMSSENLFMVLDSMLYHLKDGHVNLTSSFNQSRYDFWADSPRNFVEAIVESNRYLGTDYRKAAGFKYKIFDDNIGYIYYGSFSYPIGEGNLDQVLNYFAVCNGLIIDVRQNGGGNLTYSDKIASRFTNDRVLTGYICHKNGPGHSDFSKPYPIYLEPSSNIRWQKPVVILTNSYSYSATNDFVSQMRELPNVTIMGGKTGGGSGMPFTSELPNGWSLRYSASPHFDANMQSTEFGIEPDIHVDMIKEDMIDGIDTIIETARQYLTNL